MAIKSVSKTLSDLAGLPPEVRVWGLRQHPRLIPLYLCAMHPDVKWALPEGDPPFKRNEFTDQENMLWSELRRMYLFIEGGHPTLKQSNRERLFVELLESLPPEDAALILAAKRKEMPYKEITYELVSEAFPGILPEAPAPKKRRARRHKSDEQAAL